MSLHFVLKPYLQIEQVLIGAIQVESLQNNTHHY